MFRVREGIVAMSALPLFNKFSVLQPQIMLLLASAPEEPLRRFSCRYDMEKVCKSDRSIQAIRLLRTVTSGSDSGSDLMD